MLQTKKASLIARFSSEKLKLVLYVTLNRWARTDEITIAVYVIDPIHTWPKLISRYACHRIRGGMTVVATIPVGVANVV